MAKNPFAVEPLSETAFSKAEAGMKIDKVGNGSFSMDLHGPSLSSLGKPSSGRPQSPAQHASVQKAGRTSAAKRKAQAFGR